MKKGKILLSIIFVFGLIFSSIITQNATKSNYKEKNNDKSEEIEPMTSAEQYEPNNFKVDASLLSAGTYKDLEINRGSVMEKKRKDCYIQARITVSERKNIEKIANEFEITVSDVIRLAIFKFLGDA